MNIIMADIFFVAAQNAGTVNIYNGYCIGKYEISGRGLSILMKKISVFVMAFMLSLLVFGCEEVENKDSIETGKDVETSLVEKIDLSEISAPEEIAVYSASFFDRKPEEIAHIFLGDSFEEGETYAEGRRFESDAGTKKEKFVYAYDSGRAFFGDSRISGNNGVNFVSCFEFCYNKIDNNNDEFDNLRNEYWNAGRISGEESDGQDRAFSDKQELTSEYLEKLGVEGYELYSAGTFNAEKKKCCLMYFKQMIDGIPVSTIATGNGRQTYNSRYKIVDEKIGVLNADVDVCFLGDELVRFYCQSLINVGKQLRKYPLIPIDEAYEKVKKFYPVAAGTEGKYELERAELQYKVIMPDYSVEEIYLYPFWIFGVHDKGEEDYHEEYYHECMYYIVDAITGELFSGISEEFLQ